MNKNPFLIFPALMVGSLLMVLVVASAFLHQNLPSSLNLTASLSQPAPPLCPFEEGFTPFNVTATSSLALKQESLLLKAFLDKVENCKEDYNLNTCLALFQEYCVSQGKCTTHYSFSQPATITPEIKNLLCEEWNKRYLLLYEDNNWKYLTNLFNSKQTELPSYLINNRKSYLSWKQSLNTTTTAKITSTTTSSTTKLTTVTTSSGLSANWNIERFKPVAKDYPVLSVSPDIDISKFVPAGADYTPRIESWIYYLDSGMYGLNVVNNKTTISHPAYPAATYRIFDLNSSRKFKVELIDKNGFTDITNSPSLKWEVVMPMNFGSQNLNCFYFKLAGLTQEEKDQIAQFVDEGQLKPFQARARLESLRKEKISPALQQFLDQDINKLNEFISQKYKIPLSSFLMVVSPGIFQLKDASEFIEGHYVDSCRQVNKGEDTFQNNSFGGSFVRCIFDYYQKDGNKWNIDEKAVAQYKADYLKAMDTRDPNHEYISVGTEKFADSIGIQEGFCLNNLTQEQIDILGSINEKGLEKVSYQSDQVIPLSFNTDDYLTINQDGTIQTYNKDGVFYVKVTSNDDSFSGLIKQFLHWPGYHRVVGTITFPVVILDFNKLEQKIAESVNVLTANPGIQKLLKQNYTTIPGLYGSNWECSPPGHAPNGEWFNTSWTVQMKGNYITTATDPKYPVPEVSFTEIYSMFPDTIFTSSGRLSFLDKELSWFRNISPQIYPVFREKSRIESLIEYWGLIPLVDKDMFSFYNFSDNISYIRYDYGDSVFDSVDFNQATNKAANGVTVLVSGKSYSIGVPSSNVFKIMGASLNKTDWRDTLEFRTIYCAKVNPAGKVGGGAPCQGGKLMELCKGYGKCASISSCTLKDPKFKGQYLNPDGTPKAEWKNLQYCQRGDTMMCPEDCRHDCTTDLQCNQ